MEGKKKNPIQVVLNSRNYVTFQDNLPGGGPKDFFGGNDAAFIKHKGKLKEQLGSIQAVLNQSESENIAYVKVKMRKEALAKSHRPIGAIFKRDKCPPAGSDGIGELYYMVSNVTLPSVLQSISRAEEETRYKTDKNTGKEKFNPSRNRSEVGAIQDISLPEVADKRSFSVPDGIKWLENERSGRMYIISIFHLPPTLGEFQNLTKSEIGIFENFISGLNSFPFGIQIFRSSLTNNSAHNFLFIRPTKVKRNLEIRDLFTKWDDKMASDLYEESENYHNILITFLSNHRIIRKIMLPPLIQSTQQAHSTFPGTAAFPVRNPERRYPKVGIVDGGVDSGISDWRLGFADVIAEEHRSESHGNFIAGLLIAGRAAGNHPNVAREEDGCDIYDVDIFPNGNIPGAFAAYYPRGFEDFFQELDLAIARAKKDFGLRIFNISLNIIQEVDEDQYGPAAIMLDAISERHDVILVISAGNLPNNAFRGPWPDQPSRVAGYLLPYASFDRIYQPAESVYSITVGAINPPGISGQLGDAPAPYTRRGPGMSVGLKPDFCHYGGTVALQPGGDMGLYSLGSNGEILSGCGTSYAAPFLAKTLAAVDNLIDGHVSKETLLALLIHSASRPKPLDHKELDTITKNFVGFGLPASAEDTLLTDDSSITMVFHSTLSSGKQLDFDFSWPQALVSANGKCRGEAKMTLTYKPVIDSTYGAEFVRVNLDAYLRQSNGRGGFEGRAEQIYMKGHSNDSHFEADLIEHGLKWWPSKRYQMKPTNGKGKSSDWKLVVKPLVGASTIFPAAGVPFSLILTISDPKKTESIFNDMRLWLSANSVQVDDIRTAARIRPTQ